MSYKKIAAGYIPPNEVVSPKKYWEFADLVYHSETAGGDASWSIATGYWKSKDADGNLEKRERLAIRWNGDEHIQKGSPKSHGYPTWFILPEAVESGVLKSLSDPPIGLDKDAVSQARKFLKRRESD